SKPQVEADFPLETVEFRNDRGVILGVNDYGDIVVILRRRPDHRRAADVDIFYRVFHRHVWILDRLTERGQVDGYQVNRFDAVFRHFRLVRFVRADAENAAVDLRVQGFDAAVEHLGKSRNVRNIPRGHTVLAQRLRGAAR